MTARKPTALRRTEIADAALQVVAAQGIAALTTRVLAEAVGLTTGALFKHFASREDLLLGMAERVAQLLQATYPDPSLPPRVRLAHLAQARLSLVADRAGVLTLVLSEQFALALPEDAATVLREAIGATHAFVAAAIREGQAEESIRADVPAEALALLLMGAIQVTALAHRTGAVSENHLAFDAFDVLIQPTTPLETP